MAFIFEKAERKKSKLRLGLTGPSGAGKTYGALLVAKGIGGKIAVIDTEHGSASLYTDLVDFDVLNLPPPYSPENFIAALQAAEQAGYQTVIIDSVTHEWSGKGGCLELQEELTRSKYRGNSYQAWSEITPRHRAFLDAIIQSACHVIVTMRSKTDMAMQESITGKKQVVKLGMKSEQRDGFEYELSLVLDIIHDGHFAVASKDRTGLFVDKDPKPITTNTGTILLAWLENGIAVEHKPEPEPTQEPEEISVHIERIKNCKKMPELLAVWQTLDPAIRKQCESTKNEMKTKLTA
jgi:hypothetical protein